MSTISPALPRLLEDYEEQTIMVTDTIRESLYWQDNGVDTTRTLMRILSLVLRGKLKPGTQLIERELAEQLGCARATIRNALKAWTLPFELSIFSTHANTGSKLAHVDQDKVIDIQSNRALYEITAAMEAADKIGNNHSAMSMVEIHSHKKRLKAIINEKPSEKIDKELVVLHFFVKDMAFHNLLLEIAGVGSIAKQIRSLLHMMLFFNENATKLTSDDLDKLHLQHKEIAQAILDGGKGADVKELMTDHLDHAMNIFCDLYKTSPNATEPAKEFHE